jgi:hypothetical protein
MNFSLTTPFDMTLDTRKQPKPELYHYFDYFGNPVIIGDIKSYLDSLGRLILTWIAYDMPDELIDQIELHLSFERKYSVLFRHPGTWDKTSRDHWSYFIIYRHLLREKRGDSDEFFWSFCADIPKMRGITTWKNALADDRKAERRYYRTGIPGARIGNIVLNILNYLGQFGPEWDNNAWIKPILKYSEVNAGIYAQRTRTPWQNFIGRATLLIMPAYALHNKALQIYVMPEGAKKARIQEILLKRIGKSNIVVRLLLNDRTVTLRELRNYPDMSGYRPGVYLKPGCCFRDIHKLPEAQAAANNYEKQFAIWLFYSQKTT